MTYTIIRKILDNGNRNNVVTKEKLDVFLVNNRITTEEYNELIECI